MSFIASSPDQATSIGTSAAPRRSTTSLRGSPSGISSSTCFAGRETNDFRRSIARSTRSRDTSGLEMKPIAPESSARSRASSVDTTHTGMWRVERSALSRSSTRQPCMSGRKMSSVSTAGWYSRTMARAAAPVEPTTPLKPFSRAASSRILAKPRSFSTISSTWSPGWMSSRSSAASLANCSPVGSSGEMVSTAGVRRRRSFSADRACARAAARTGEKFCGR